MKILLIDNYDSFTYNLKQVLEELENNVAVQRNDQIDFNLAEESDAIVISPGPSLPKDAGSLIEFIKSFSHKPILGICLGMQAIGEVYNAKLSLLEKPLHGIQTTISHSSHPLFGGVPTSFQAGRYHSWIVDVSESNEEIEVLAKHDDVVMSIGIKNKEIYGLQFHPESIMTPDGKLIISNFLKRVK